MEQLLLAAESAERALTEATGLTWTQAQILLTVDRFGSPIISDLAHATGKSNSTLTTLLDRMEEKGLVHRERIPDNRRAYRVTIAKPEVVEVIVQAMVDFDQHLPTSVRAWLSEVVQLQNAG